MKTKFSSVLSLFLIVTLLGLSQGHDHCADTSDNLQKINTLNLLMPLIFDESSSRSIQYTLKGYHGTYEWESSEPNILKVDAVKNDSKSCYSEALVSVATYKPYNNVVWIKAENTETRDIVKCESKVAKIKRIEILTKFRTIDVGDLEVLELLGYDEEGNVFSTLEGLRFEWTIGNQNLEYVPLKDTNIRSTETRRKIETQNYQSDIIVVRGKRTGKAPVSVKLKEKDYGDVSTTVTISVIEHFVVVPKSPIYVLPLTTLGFRLYTISSDLNKAQSKAVTLPSPTYLWSNKMQELGALEQNGILECGKEKGRIDFIVQDTQSVENKYNGEVYIVHPYGLNLYIKEFEQADWEEKDFDLFKRSSQDLEKFDNVWTLIKGQTYHIRAQIFDEDRNIIHITPNIKINIKISNAYVEVLEVRNHEIKVRAKELITKNTIEANIVEIKNSKGSWTPNVKETKDFSIVTKVAIIKPNSFIHLPLSSRSANRNPNNQQIFQLAAIGGSKSYEYISLDMNIAVVGNSGIIIPKAVGRTVIQVKDRANYKNVDQIELEVSHVSNVDFLERYKELTVGQIGYLNAFAVGGKLNARYSNCSFLSISPSLIENNEIASHIKEKKDYNDYISYLDDVYRNNVYYKRLLSDYENSYLSYEKYESYVKDGILTSAELKKIISFYLNFGMCSEIQLEGVYKGEAQVQGILNGGFSDTPILSLDRSRLRVYEKISIVSPNIQAKNLITNGTTDILLTYGSSFELELQGGPYKWDRRRLNTETAFESRKPSGDRLLEIEKLNSLTTKTLYRVQCKYPRSQTESTFAYNLTYTAWNEPDENLPETVRQSYFIFITCSVPHHLKIYIQNKDRFLSINDVQNALSESFTLRNQHSHIFQTWVYDENKRPFYNFSTLNIDWKLTPEDAGRLYRTKSPEHDKLPLSYRDEFQTLHLDTNEKEVKLRATSMNYEIYGDVPLSFEQVYDEIIISIKGDIDIDPPFKILYLDRDNFYDAEILKGSGEFSVEVSNSTVIKHTYDRATKKIRVHPLTLGQAEIKVEDTKLISSQTVTSKVIVTTVGRIELTLKKSLIQEEDRTIAIAEVYDLEGNRFDDDQVKYMGLEILIYNHQEYKGSHLEITRYENYHSQFEILGKRSGEYRLFVRAEVLGRRSGSENLEKKILYSGQVSLSVFSKLEVVPSTLLVSPGCSSSVELKGGPSNTSQSNFRITAKIENSNLINVLDPEVEHYSVFSVIKGIKVGKTHVVYEVYHVKGDFITSVSLPVEIDYPDRIDIQGLQDRKIHVGAQFRLIAHTSLNNRIFHAAICPYQYTWKTSSDYTIQIEKGPEVSVALSDLGLDGDMTMTSYYFAVNATALRPGYADIELSIEAHYFNPTYFKKSYYNSFRVQVIDRLTSYLPTYIGEESSIPSVLLLPPSVSYQIRHIPEKQSVKFSLLCSGSSYGLSLSTSGVITANSDSGRGTVLVEDSATYTQLMMVNVAVTNIFSIFIQDSYQATNMNLRGEKNLNIYLQDVNGRLFPAPGDLQGLVLSVYVSNNTVIDAFIENSVLRIKTKTQGVAICRVYLTENPMIFDSFIVSVGSALLPGSALIVHVGGIVQFKVGAASSRSRRWSSDNPEIMEIDAYSGRGYAKKEGKTDIIFSDSSTTLIKVNVIKVDNIDKVSDVSVLTNIPSNVNFRSEYKIDFKAFSGNNELKFFSNDADFVNNNLQFRCETDQNDWIDVSGDIEDKIPRCIVHLRKSYPDYSNFPEDITLTATISSKDSYSKFKYSESFQFKALWAFKPLDNVEKVYVHRTSNTKILTFKTPERLEVLPGGELKNCVETTFDKDRQLMKVKISVPTEKSAFDSNILIENPKTKQSEKIPVTYTRLETAPQDVKPSNFTFGDIVIIFAVVIAILAFVFLNQGQRTDQPHPHYN